MSRLLYFNVLLLFLIPILVVVVPFQQCGYRMSTRFRLVQLSITRFAMKQHGRDNAYQIQHSIPEHALIFTASRSSGPGGQNVNKINSKIELRGMHYA